MLFNNATYIKMKIFQAAEIAMRFFSLIRWFQLTITFISMCFQKY